ncbi:TetR family transcriptional regulator [Nocardia sp. NPDC049526]|uniref:TetR family transcriptional regulator n=1 Tax=Nocardia sp. NPDC049526 TaxID=3364316 RepID=UPI00379E4203
MSGTKRTRMIARAAVRADLAQVAYELTRERGFHNVTVDDMAAAAGVSRSTLLRYFGSKEEAVLSAFDAHADQFADALRARPAEEDDWTALRRALGGVIEFYLQDPVAALAMTRLIFDTPELSGRQLEKQHSWRPALTAALAERAGVSEPVPISVEIKVAAATSCLNIAVERWSASNGELDLAELLDEGFDALSSARNGRAH